MASCSIFVILNNDRSSYPAPGFNPDVVHELRSGNSFFFIGLPGIKKLAYPSVSRIHQNSSIAAGTAFADVVYARRKHGFQDADHPAVQLSCQGRHVA
jgi:hypothetical protein